MALEPPPPRLDAQIGPDGVRATLRGYRIQVTEWAITLEERGLFGGARTVIPLSDLRGAYVSPSTRDESWFALVLDTPEGKVIVGSGDHEERLRWVWSAIVEAERTRARREGVEGREYLFQKVVPDEVKDLIER